MSAVSVVEPSAGLWMTTDGAGAKVTDTEWADRFAWERLPGSSVQTSWHRDLRWLAGKGDRIDFGEDAPNGQPSLIWLAYVDHATGWALASEVEQTNIGSEF